MFTSLARRTLVGELMDAPGLAEDVHQRALRGLKRVNRISRTSRIISKAILNCSELQALPTVRVLDLACGGGDVTIEVSERLKANGISAQVQGWDRSQTAIEFARRQASKSPSRDIDFRTVDAFSDIAQSSFDVIYCTLFLHHLSDSEACRLVKQMWLGAKHLVLIDDLRRSAWGYSLAVIGCRLLSRSPLVHVDGPRSVRAAFTEAEIELLADESELPRPIIVRHWPHRFLLTWNPSQ